MSNFQKIITPQHNYQPNYENVCVEHCQIISYSQTIFFIVINHMCNSKDQLERLDLILQVH